MRHAAEGDLHAYLDGGLEAYPPGEAERLRAHIEACPDCRERLEAERAVRERADAVLSMSGPGHVDAPPFEELRRRAVGTPERERAGGSPGRSRTAALRTAAVAVLALGTGWVMGRHGTDAGAPGSRAGDLAASSEERTAFVADPSPAAGGAEVGADVGGEPDPARAGTEAAAAADAAAVADVAEQEAAGSRTARSDVSPPGRAGAGAVAGERAAADAPEERVAAADVAPATPSAVEDAGPADIPAPAPSTVRAEAEGAPDRPAVSVEADSLGGGPPDRALAARGESVAGLPSAPADDRARYRRAPVDEAGIGRRVPLTSMQAFPDRPREAAPSRPMTVPGLDVLSLEWTEVAPGRPGLRVVQRLVTGDTLELRFGGLDGSGPVPDLLLRESLPGGVRQVVVPFAAGWLVARAPLTEAQIRALVALIS